jgi:hypothetical protein
VVQVHPAARLVWHGREALQLLRRAGGGRLLVLNRQQLAQQAAQRLSLPPVQTDALFMYRIGSLMTKP